MSSIGQVFDTDAETQKRIKAMLPKAAQAKLKSEEKFAIIDTAPQFALAKRRKELVMSRSELKRRHEHLLNDKASYGPALWAESGLEPRLREILLEVADLDKEIAELDPPQPAKLSRAELSLRARLSKFVGPSWGEFLLKQNPTSRFKVCDVVLPKLAKGETVRDQLNNIRAQGDAIVRKIVEISAAPLDVDTQIAIMRDDVRSMAAKPDLSKLLRYDAERKTAGSIVWPEQTIYQTSYTDTAIVQEGTSIVAWLFGAEMEAKLEAEIRAKAGDGGLSITQKIAKIAAAETELLALQRVEERLFVAARAAGADVKRRPTHALAFLEIEGDAAGQAKEQERLDHIGKERMAKYAGTKSQIGFKIVS